jgi:hypothetical protein
VTTRLAAGEDARAKVCAQSIFMPTSVSCRAVAVPGLRSLNVALRLPDGPGGWVEVSVRFAAESNRTRRTVVVERTPLGG